MNDATLGFEPTVTLSGAMPRERVEWHLWNWELWITRSRSPGQLPKWASGGLRGYASFDSDPDADYEEMDRFSGAATNAVISGMPMRLQIAVRVQHGVMAAVYRLRDHAGAYAEACSILAVELPKRALC